MRKRHFNPLITAQNVKRKVKKLKISVKNEEKSTDSDRIQSKNKIAWKLPIPVAYFHFQQVGNYTSKRTDKDLGKKLMKA
jgi:hypothetical protein